MRARLGGHREGLPSALPSPCHCARAVPGKCRHSAPLDGRSQLLSWPGPISAVHQAPPWAPTHRPSGGCPPLNEASSSQILRCPGMPGPQHCWLHWFGILGETLPPLPAGTGSCVQRGSAVRETCALYNTSTLCRGNPRPPNPPRPSDLRDRGAAAGARAMGMKSHHRDGDKRCRGVQQHPLSPLLPPSLCPCLLQH